MNLNYDKIRWPMFPHNCVLNKRNSVFLPQSSSEIHKMFGLVRGTASMIHDFTPQSQPNSGHVTEDVEHDKVKVAFDTDYECANAD
jgi:hypothetical protein